MRPIRARGPPSSRRRRSASSAWGPRDRLDIKVIGPDPTDDERAAVDALLGPPASGWHGGARNVARDGRSARGSREAEHGRDQLLPAFHAVQDRIGWISQGALNYICRRLTVPPAEAWGVLTFYHLFATEPRPPVVAHVCDDLACRLRGAERLCADLERRLGPEGVSAQGGLATWHRSPCLGLCERAPATLVVAAGVPCQTETLAPEVRADAVAEALARGGLAGATAPGPLESLRR